MSIAISGYLGRTVNFNLLSNASSIASKTASKIREFADLRDGWEHGIGVRFSKSVVDAALKIDFFARAVGFSETDAFPSFEGDIQVVIYDGDDALEVFARRDGVYDILQEHAGTIIQNEDDLDWDNIKQCIVGMKRDWIWNSFVSSQDINMMPLEDASAVLRSVTAGPEFPLWTRHAHAVEPTPHAHISSASTDRFLKSLYFTGSSLQGFFLPIAKSERQSVQAIATEI
jgi:hypothetical protein